MPVFEKSSRRAEPPAALGALLPLRAAGQLDTKALPMLHADALASHDQRLRAEAFAGHRSGVRSVDRRTLQLAAGEA